jgi:membrane protease YdiL (CAAX protease family)
MEQPPPPPAAADADDQAPEPAVSRLGFGLPGALWWLAILMFVEWACARFAAASVGGDEFTAQVAGDVGVLLAVLLIVHFNFVGEMREALALRGAHARQLLCVLLLLPPALVLNAAYAAAFVWLVKVGIFDISLLYDYVTDPLSELTKAVRGLPWLVLVLFSWGFVPGVGEEAFFRGFLGRNVLAQKGLVRGVLITAALFGLYHLNVDQGIHAALYGVLVHVVYLSCRSLLAPALLHAATNVFIASWDELPPAWLPRTFQFTGHPPLLPVLAAAVCVVCLCWLLVRMRTRFLLPDGSEWSPGYPTAELPPAGAQTTIEVRTPPWPLLLLTGAAYALFLTALFRW